MKRLLILASLFTITTSLYSQTSFSEINRNHTWAWLGLDFSNTKLLGREGFNNPKKIIDHYFIAWNQLIFDEGDKYNVLLNQLHSRKGATKARCFMINTKRIKVSFLQ